jgi:hypothetical protein
MIVLSRSDPILDSFDYLFLLPLNAGTVVVQYVADSGRRRDDLDNNNNNKRAAVR